MKSDTQTTRTCTSCMVMKPWSEFSKNIHCRQGINPRCKQCVRKYHKTYQQTDKGKELYRAASAKYRKKFMKTNAMARILKIALKHGLVDTCKCKNTNPIIEIKMVCSKHHQKVVS